MLMPMVATQTPARPATNGAAIKALREAYGWQAKKFAAAVGISAPYYSRIETGDRQASPAVLRAIANTLGVPLAAIIGRHTPSDVA